MNLLQQSPQPLLQAGMQTQSPPSPTPQQIAEVHNHFKYMQKMLDSLIKLPDSELNLKAVIEAAADAIEQYQLSGGKKGISAEMVAMEMSNPNFPTISSSAQQIRQFLQNYFDKSVMMQAGVTSRFGATQSQPNMGNS